jgi:hypothetical protein
MRLNKGNIGYRSLAILYSLPRIPSKDASAKAKEESQGPDS